MAGRHRSDHVAIKVPDEPGSPTHSRHAGHALRGQSACPRPQYPTLRGNRTIKNEAKKKPRVGNIRFYPPATRRQANILHRTAKTCTSTPSANNFLPPRQDSVIAPFALHVSVYHGLEVAALRRLDKVAMLFRDFVAAPETPIFLSHIRQTLPDCHTEARAHSKLSSKMM